MLGESEYENLITGADSFTPDGRLIMNESAEVSDLSISLIDEHRPVRSITISWPRVPMHTVLLLLVESANTWPS